MKKLIFKLTNCSGLNRIIRLMKSGPTVLFYHGVEERIVDPNVQSLHLALPDFEKQVTYLRKNFEIVSIEDLAPGNSGGRNCDPSQVVLTFDDGYKNNLDIVAPYLSSLNIPFSVYVSTRHIEEGRRFPTYILRVAIAYTERRRIKILHQEFDLESDALKAAAKTSISDMLKKSQQQVVDRIVEDLIAALSDDQWNELNDRFRSDAPMDWEEVKRLHEFGAVIGSHCHDHMLLHKGQDIEEIDRQLKVSRSLISQHIGQCSYIAYPNGTTSDMFPEALSRVRASGYTVGMTTVNGEATAEIDRLLLPRIGTSTTDFDQFKFIVNSSFRHNRSKTGWYRSFGGQKVLPDAAN